MLPSSKAFFRNLVYSCHLSGSPSVLKSFLERGRRFFDEIDSIMFDQTLMEMKQLVLIEAALLQIFFSIVAALLFVVSVLFLQPLLTPRKLEKSYRKASGVVNREPSALGGSTGFDS